MKLFGLEGSLLGETGENFELKKPQWWHYASQQARFQGMHKLCEKKLSNSLQPICEAGFSLFSEGMNPAGNPEMQLDF